MKVLHVTNLYPYKDHSTYGIFIKEQIDSLENKNFQDVFFINAKKDGLRAYYDAFKDLKKIVGNYDIIHCHHQFSAIIILLCKTRKSIVLSLLGDISKRSFSNKFVYSIVKTYCSIIIFKNKLPNHSPEKVLLPNGVKLNFFKPIDKLESKKRLDLETDKRYILFVCNGPLENPIKRHDKFEAVINGFKKVAPNGKEYEPLYLSKVSREDVPYYFSAADFMLLTSDHEGSPNALKEAMACNLPIISTAVGDVPILLEGVNNCYVSNNGTIEELVNLCVSIDVNKESDGRERLIDLGLDSISIAKKLTKVYSEVFRQ